MPDSQNSNSDNMNELLKSLQSATALMQNLLSDIKEHSTSLAMVKAKVESLSENVEVLSHVVRDGNGEGSMITRLALIEKSLEDIEEELHETKEANVAAHRELKRIIDKERIDNKQSDADTKKLKMEKRIASIKLWGALFAAFAAMAFQVFAMIHTGH